MTNIKTYGTRAEVFHETAKMTTGKLTKKDLIKNKHGRIVSLKKVKQSKNKKYNPLLNTGLQVTKGSKEFGVKQMQNTKNTKNTKKNNTKKKSKSYFNNFFKILSE